MLLSPEPERPVGINRKKSQFKLICVIQMVESYKVRIGALLSWGEGIRDTVLDRKTVVLCIY